MPMHPILRLPPVRPNTKYNHQGQHTSYRHKCTQFYLHPFIHPSQLDKNWNWKIGWITLLLFVGQWSKSIQRLQPFLWLFERVKRSEIYSNLSSLNDWFQYDLAKTISFGKAPEMCLPLAIQRLRFPMAQLLGEKGKKGWLLPQPLDRSVQMASLGIVLKKLPRISIDSTRGGYQTFYRNRQSDDFYFDFNLQIGSG